MDNLSKSQRHKNMQRIRSVGTMPERVVISALKQKKLYFRINVSSLYGKPDIVFRKKRIVIFIDSDFWHGNSKRFVMPSTNRDYWRAKIGRNRDRDKKVNQFLKKEGWHVLRFWESDIKKNINKVITRIVITLEK
jgi:DNA mismatch endonuclease, patch repair protein